MSEPCAPERGRSCASSGCARCATRPTRSAPRSRATRRARPGSGSGARRRSSPRTTATGSAWPAASSTTTCRRSRTSGARGSTRAARGRGAGRALIEAASRTRARAACTAPSSTVDRPRARRRARSTRRPASAAPATPSRSRATRRSPSTRWRSPSSRRAPIETERLLLRPYTEADFEALHAIQSRDDVDPLAPVGAAHHGADPRVARAEDRRHRDRPGRRRASRSAIELKETARWPAT